MQSIAITETPCFHSASLNFYAAVKMASHFSVSFLKIRKNISCLVFSSSTLFVRPHTPRVKPTFPVFCIGPIKHRQVCLTYGAPLQVSAYENLMASYVRLPVIWASLFLPIVPF